MATVADIIKRALRSIKATDAAETPDTTTYADCVESLNGMFSSWSVEPQAIYAPTQVTSALTADTVSVTIGSGADIDTTRPKKIYSAYLRDSASQDYPLEVRALKEYENVSLKEEGGLPKYMYVRKGYPNWTIYFEVALYEGFTIYLELLQPLPTFTDETDTFSLPKEYEDATVYNLAVRLQPEYPLTDTFQLVAGLAAQTLKTIKTLNLHPIPELITDFPGVRKRTSIFVG